MRVLICVVGLSLHLVALGQTPESGPDVRAWQAGVEYTYDRVSDGRQDWQRVDARVGRSHARLSTHAFAAHVVRLGDSASLVGAEAYLDMWPGSYAHLSVSHAPDATILARTHVSGHLSQAIGGGLELTGSYQLRDYDRDQVHIPGMQIGWYVRNWFLRARTTIVPLRGELGVGQVLSARYYGHDIRHYLDMSAGAGRSVEILEAPGAVVLATTYAVNVRYQRPISDQLVTSVGLGYADDDFYRRITGSVAIALAW